MRMYHVIAIMSDEMRWTYSMVFLHLIDPFKPSSSFEIIQSCKAQASSRSTPQVRTYCVHYFLHNHRVSPDPATKPKKDSHQTPEIAATSTKRLCCVGRLRHLQASASTQGRAIHLSTQHFSKIMWLGVVGGLWNLYYFKILLALLVCVTGGWFLSFQIAFGFELYKGKSLTQE